MNGLADEARRLWDRYCDHLYVAPELGFSLDISRMRFDADYLDDMAAPISAALDALRALEGGALANPDEARMVGHYWLRAPEIAPDLTIRRAVLAARHAVAAFAADLRGGVVRGAGGSFRNLLHIGIGGSGLGPQLACDVAGRRSDSHRVYFLDNADPDGVDRTLSALAGDLGRTLVSVVSKSGLTPTPLRVLREVERAYENAGLDFAAHAVTTTMPDSGLDRRARAEGWLARFPIWEWVGGRTSITSAVGLLPLAFLDAPFEALLDGAAAMDRLARVRRTSENPAALLALMWFWANGGTAERRHMVVLPYKDRLALLPRYVQQLVMESVGKRVDRRGRVVHHGLTVYGHKGSTDQHAYLQQLRDGPADFFLTFIRVRQERCDPFPGWEAGISLGDHLFANLEGTRNALYSRGRDSITITVPDAGLRCLGALIALFERAVGLYAELIDVNAYHQPGVDKYAAAGTLDLFARVTQRLGGAGTAATAAEVAEAIGRPESVETVFKLLENLAAQRRGVTVVSGTGPRDLRFAACHGDEQGSSARNEGIHDVLS